CEVVRWLGERAEEAGVMILPGFPADALLVDGDDVIGVRTAPRGLGRDGEPGGSGYMPPVDLTARVTVLSEGTRGALTQAYMEWQGIGSANPQIHSLGVKELWEVKRPLDRIIHTMGWPLIRDGFGGTFAYPLADDLVALGLVVSLDYADARLDVHGLLQRVKHHPLFHRILAGGEMVEWGAKTIPEGGYHSLPERRHGGGICIVGDAAGYVDVASLKGIHYAMQSGILAARTIHAALKAGDVSAAALAPYTAAVDKSFIVRDLRRNRNMRLAFKSGFFLGGAKASLATVTGGRLPAGRIRTESDAGEPKWLGAETAAEPTAPAGPLAVSKVDAVFKSGNQTRDDIPSHLAVGEDMSAEVAEMYVHMCPAGVYERDGDELRVNAPNCVDCKATDVLGPRWSPREGGSGPRYRRM
ncbi:MAG: electron transfer flavoprotein, partial [Gemmatimonadetes bacterium]|nr:electron transfer flavoprotein [Gemmatimonadota bacterium]